MPQIQHAKFKFDLLNFNVTSQCLSDSNLKFDAGRGGRCRGRRRRRSGRGRYLR